MGEFRDWMAERDEEETADFTTRSRPVAASLPADEDGGCAVCGGKHYLRGPAPKGGSAYEVTPCPACNAEGEKPRYTFADELREKPVAGPADEGLRAAAQAVFDSVRPDTRSGRPTIDHDALKALAAALDAAAGCLPEDEKEEPHEPHEQGDCGEVREKGTGR